MTPHNFYVSIEIESLMANECKYLVAYPLHPSWQINDMPKLLHSSFMILFRLERRFVFSSCLL